jgi:N-acetylglucosaminyldiphosphoundecaprenol N-acetyl-beta-D-mannosaminyltransferase
MQRYALEWLHRLCADPRRLLKRYLVTNTLFVMGMAKQFVSRKKTPP